MRTKGFGTSYLGPNFVSSTQSHTNPRRFCQESRSTERVKQKLSSHAFVSRWTCQSLCQQYLDTPRECFQLVSERARERVVVGRQATAFVVSCDIVTCSAHEDRPSADSCLGGYSSFGSFDHDRSSWEKWHNWWDKILLFQCQKL